jgi:hypothetical protein
MIYIWSIYNKHTIYIYDRHIVHVQLLFSEGLNLGLHIYNNETYRIPNHLKENI